VYYDWLINHLPQLYLMQEVVAEQIADFAKFPPRQKPASFNLDAVLAQVSGSTGAPASNGKTAVDSKGGGSEAVRPPSRVAASGA
jgi:hypothetical protein